MLSIVLQKEQLLFASVESCLATRTGASWGQKTFNLALMVNKNMTHLFHVPGDEDDSQDEEIPTEYTAA